MFQWTWAEGYFKILWSLNVRLKVSCKPFNILYMHGTFYYVSTIVIFSLIIVWILKKFPFLCNNISSSLASIVFISQLILYARTCFSHECFILRATLRSNKLLKQGYILEWFLVYRLTFSIPSPKTLQEFQWHFKQVTKSPLSILVILPDLWEMKIWYVENILRKSSLIDRNTICIEASEWSTWMHWSDL